MKSISACGSEVPGGAFVLGVESFGVDVVIDGLANALQVIVYTTILQPCALTGQHNLELEVGLVSALPIQCITSNSVALIAL